MRQPNVELYRAIDPKMIWRRGSVLGWLIRFRGIGTIAVLGVAACPVVWQRFGFVMGVGAALVVVLAVSNLVQLRTHRLRELRTNELLHYFCHATRDDLAQILAEKDEGAIRVRVQTFNQNAAQRVAEFFGSLLPRSAINCAIRLATTVREQQVYATVGRSRGMDPARADRSVPIPAEVGLPRTLRSAGAQGVLLIGDIREAITHGLWLETPNDELPDVRAVMAAPINGWEDSNKVMLGILYVTSDSDVFRPEHTVPVKAFADLLGLAYPLLLSNIGRA